MNLIPSISWTLLRGSLIFSKLLFFFLFSCIFCIILLILFGTFFFINLSCVISGNKGRTQCESIFLTREFLLNIISNKLDYDSFVIFIISYIYEFYYFIESFNLMIFQNFIYIISYPWIWTFYYISLLTVNCLFILYTFTVFPNMCFSSLISEFGDI